MDEKAWKAYEAQHAELKRQYRRIRLRIFLVWLGYFAVSTVLLRLVVYSWRMDVGVGTLVFNTVVSVFMMLFAINRRLKEEQAHRQALVEQAPVGRMQL